LEPRDCFRITPGCEQQGRSAAAWAKKSGAARVTLVREAGSRRSESIAAAFGSRARELGLTVAGEFYASEKAELINLILASRPDLVFYSGEEAPYSETHRFFSALRAFGYAQTLLTGEADPEVSFLATRPDLQDGMYLVSPFAPAPPELAARMATTPGPHVTAGYFAMKATLEAIDRANSIDLAELQRAAARLPYFDAQGRAALRTCALYVARSGKFEFVELLE
jgi:ABC-type branched-subunit amino acid transport system substrate-binding protein